MTGLRHRRLHRPGKKCLLAQEMQFTQSRKEGRKARKDI